MKISTLISCFVLLALITQAQDIKVPTSSDIQASQQAMGAAVESTTTPVNIGGLLGQLAGNLSDDAFTESFKEKKSDFISEAGNIVNPEGASSALLSLQGGLVPSAMNAGWDAVKDSWIKDANTANTVKSVASLAGTLESQISDKYFSGTWATARPAWQAALSALSK